jgi:reductive dehalogenase
MWLNLIDFLLLAVTDAGLILLLLASLAEREKRAAVLGAAALTLNTVLWTGFLVFAKWPAVRAVNLAAAALAVALGSLSWIKFFPRRAEEPWGGEIIRRYDERDHMFSRNNLKFHPRLAGRYYRLHPENKEADKAIHRKPELGEKGQVFHHSLYSPALVAAFEFLDRIRPASEGPVASDKAPVAAEDTAEALRQVAHYYGADDVGFVRLKPHHLYSRRGRQAEHWGEKVDLGHATAVVIISAMDSRMLKMAPALPIILESGRQYVEVAKVACILAAFLRRLGYGARAHTDANYLTVCVPAAAEAGLGEVGRLGILIHPRFGPCCRIALVTTDWDLPAEAEAAGPPPAGVEEFCRVCRKCADNCPAQAIPRGAKPSSRGMAHWRIKQESCYSYWKSVGTDCGVCIRVCPFTKPDNLFHRLARWYVSRNSLNQRMALLLDDLLYGRRAILPKENPSHLFPE